jgi:two-component system CheB/CheR fusion protein
VLRAWSPLVLLAKRPTLSYPFKEVVNEMVNHRGLSLQIFASDIDINAIEKHVRLFSSNIVADVSAERINHNFKAETTGFREH